MPRRLAVLHHPLSFFPLDLVEAVGDYVELVWVVDSTETTDVTTSRLLPRLGTVVDIAGLNLDQASVKIAEHGPDGIVTFVDELLETVAGLAARLGLPYHSLEVAHTLTDKRVQRAVLERAGVPGPRYWTVPAGFSEGQVGEVANLVAYPVVLKPAKGSGSRGIRFIESPGELLGCLAQITDRPDYLIEEYLVDDQSTCGQWYASYLSVESVVSSGQISHVAITGRFPLAEPFRETGNFIPAILPDDSRQPVLDITTRAIAAIGITTGVLHTEVKLTPSGPRLIEVNGRLGGRPPFVLREVSSVNLFQAACAVALGDRVVFDHLTECEGVAFWLMSQPPVWAGRVEDVEGLDKLDSLCGIERVTASRSPGDSVDWQEGTSSKVLTVEGKVRSHRALEEAITRIEETVHFTYR